MKKLLGIVVLGLLWCSISFSEIISISCKETYEPWLGGSEWRDDQVDVEINTDLVFLKIKHQTGWFNLEMVPIIIMNDSKIIAEGLFMFNYKKREWRFVKDPMIYLIKPYLDEAKTVRNPDVKFNYDKLKDGDGMLKKLRFEIDRLKGTLVFDNSTKSHWIDMPAEVMLNTYTGWKKARNCQKNKKLF
jgi:hypothetical protein